MLLLLSKYKFTNKMDKQNELYKKALAKKIIVELSQKTSWVGRLKNKLKI